MIATELLLCLRRMGVSPPPLPSGAPPPAAEDAPRVVELGLGLLRSAFSSHLLHGSLNAETAAATPPSVGQLTSAAALACFAECIGGVPACCWQPPAPPHHALPRFVATIYLSQPTPGDGFALVHRIARALYVRHATAALAAGAASPSPPKDRLTKHFQRVFKTPPRFETSRQPQQRGAFGSRVLGVEGEVLGEGTGSTKRAAENAAAEAALRRLLQ